MARERIKGWRGSGWLGRTLWVLFVVIFAAPVTLLLVFRFLPVLGTPEMLLSLIEGKGAHYAWTDDISPVLGRSVIGSEDQNFCSHHGFDFKALAQVMDEHRRHPDRPMRGASTLSQQTARTLFLAPVRSWIRKGAEAWLTVLEETLWPKKRILQAYLNLVDLGNGNFGAEAAAESYFHKSARSLTPIEAARLAAILPDPDVWNAERPSPYVASRAKTIVALSAQVGRDGLDFCVR